MNGSANKSKAICILGVHRSGTSTVARAINLLGAFLGEDRDLMPATRANPEGYWERLDIFNFQERLLTQMKRTWDTAAPLPDQWHLSDELRPRREELKRLIASNFAQHPIWAWKDPRTCLLLPLWRLVLDELGINLGCVFVVRSPLDVANSLKKRDRIPLHKAFGIWFNHTIAALRDSAGLPTAFLSYDRLLQSWEPELRKCSATLGLPWPADEEPFRETINSFIRPALRHSLSSPDNLQTAPHPVRELHRIIIDALDRPSPPDAHFRETLNRLSRDFLAYSSFFESDFNSLFAAGTSRRARTDVAVVIPVFNQARYTQSCLDSLRASGVSDSQIVVVNNASTDNTAALLSERPELNVIHNDTNRGCGYAWNQGVRACQATWTILLNNDVLVPPGWLEGLLAFVEENHFDIVSPAICNGEQDYDLEAFARQFMQKMARVKRLGTASGVCFMVHHPVFDSVGLFDDDPRLGGYEDDEFFRRSRQAGFRLATTGRSFLHHFGSVTQKAIKAGMHKPRGSLGDRAYYRQKYRLTWLKRRRWRLQNQFLNAWWRTRERLRFHCTLVSDRQDGAFLWR